MNNAFRAIAGQNRLALNADRRRETRRARRQSTLKRRPDCATENREKQPPIKSAHPELVARLS